jgi:alpha/beta hydrolase fold
LAGLPPVRIHVGDDEVLLDDSRRYVERAVAAGVDAKPDVWMWMPHGFVTNVGGFNAAGQALNASGAFLAERLGGQADEISITTHEGCEPDTIQEGDSETESFNLSEIIGAGAAERSSSSRSSGQT